MSNTATRMGAEEASLRVSGFMFRGGARGTVRDGGRGVKPVALDFTRGSP